MDSRIYRSGNGFELNSNTISARIFLCHREEMGQSEATVDDSRSLTEADEKKEYDLLKQAVAASDIKNQLLKSLVKLHELRGDDAVDSKFAFESIIKPSSLRKASASKRMPFERTRSFSE